MTGATGLLVMAYGTADGPDDIERYYTDIRGGRPPSPEHLKDLRDRYAAIGNRFPLLETTRRQAELLAHELTAAGDLGEFRPYLGMKHSPPFIPDAVAGMRADDIERAVGIVMAPHWSGMSVETYIERVEKAVADEGGPEMSFVRSWYDRPEFVDLLAGRVAGALDDLPGDVRDRAAVIFSAHSLPIREREDGETFCLRCSRCEASCRYRDELQETADLVAQRVEMGTYTIAWQSAGRTADPWWGPSVDEVISQLAQTGHPAVVVCSAGFVADHLEILYDLDIEARELADRAGIAFARTRMPNADPEFITALAAVVRAELTGGEPTPDHPIKEIRT